MKVNGLENSVKIGDNAVVEGRIIGDNNLVLIEEAKTLKMELHIRGSNNVVRIGRGVKARDLSVKIGSNVPAHGVSFEVGASTSFEPDCCFRLGNSGNSLRIGRGCMLSNSIIIRTGESPHLIFDDETGDYLDTLGSVSIGDHTWVGERSYITKNARIPANTIIAACSVVTRKFDEEMTVIAGNPAVVKRRGVRWIRNRALVPKGSKFQDSLDQFDAEFATE